jgi:hypothetical protein
MILRKEYIKSNRILLQRRHSLIYNMYIRDFAPLIALISISGR